MKHNHSKSRNAWEHGTYQTGSTKPPKSRGALVAVLLILVILLAGVVSILGLMNIQLFSALQAKNSTIPVVRSGDPHASFRTAPDASTGDQPGIAILAEPVAPLYQQYYHLPAGLFINAVCEDSNAAQQGVAPGDILISLNGNPITCMDEFHAFLGKCQTGDAIQAVLYRNNANYTVTLTIEEARG